MKEKILIVGAGVCGMTLGHKLVAAGYPVTIVEKQAEIGGLARTFRYDGFCFDSGPHRFFSSNPEVIRFLEGVFPDGLLTAPMKSSVYFLGKYYDWPLKPRVLLRLPPRFLVRVFFDFLKSLFGRKGAPPKDFKDYVIRKYGRTLYDLDFGPYTEKFTKLPNTSIHPDWAKAGINRAAIDEDIKMNSLLDVIKTALKPPPRVTIYYPGKGISEFHSRLSESIVEGGGVILTRTKVASFIVEGRTIREAVLEPGGRRLKFDTVIWTAPIDEVGDLLGVAPSDLDYLNIVIFNISLRGTPKHDYQWVYFVDEDIVFNRLYNSVKFSAGSAPPGSYGLCVEVTCREGAEVWRDPSASYQEIVEALRRVEFIDDRDEVIAIHHEKLEKAYPLYKTNYRKELKERLDNLLRIKNLTLAGRTGLFWYNNMDHSIENAFEVADDVVRGRRSAESIKFWE
jgi:protoporphyrinogen oxidase